MKKSALILLSSFVFAGVVSTAFASAAEDNSQILTEGKIEATMSVNREQLVKKLQRLSSDLLKQEDIFGQNEIGDGKVHALGMLGDEVAQLLLQISNAKADQVTELNKIDQAADAIREEETDIVQN